jgi:hypothetical protein
VESLRGAGREAAKRLDWKRPRERLRRCCEPCCFVFGTAGVPLLSAAADFFPGCLTPPDLIKASVDLQQIASCVRQVLQIRSWHTASSFLFFLASSTDEASPGWPPRMGPTLTRRRRPSGVPR